MVVVVVFIRFLALVDDLLDLLLAKGLGVCILMLYLTHSKKYNAKMLFIIATYIAPKIIMKPHIVQVVVLPIAQNRLLEMCN